MPANDNVAVLNRLQVLRSGKY